MRLGIGLLHPLDTDVCINLRCREAGVSQQRLDAAQIGTAIEQVCGEAMSQLMWRNRDGNRGVSLVPSQDQPD